MPEQKRDYTRFIAPAVTAAAGAAYFFALRPWHLRWGATDEEFAITLPGDALCPNTKGQATHAITIDASPHEIWPWILQIGQDRGGFYSYTFLENLIGCEMRNTFHIVPEWQTRAVGDTVWFGAPKHFRGEARMIAAAVEPDRALVFATPADWQRIQVGEEGREGTWALVLNSIGPRKTRLIARARAGTNLHLWKRAANLAFWEPAHFVMERKMLLTIKRLAEIRSLPGK